ncbi:pyridoxal phosphate-dependent aminotransferase [Stigmatella aurantiaca]|uniref:histidinol-phosphate transaminase n=1 Tax=Stigmatella aurantiaca (strain DW4/3-1) TaxID=378806 RepID=Q095U3_STIAD|nr:histidinol-phosphate transaminase [Stigmatella aurantiaca]ADO72464.1 Histidinol-phosphate aminotransferase [Stigmatella aurantiaca DW4/3-1]EAU67473.1 histidinol-phosphate aminotransferase 2 [Stigmatella aurantiaca DW4/3-1]
MRTRPSYRDISLYSPPAVPCRVDLSDNTNLFGVPPAAERALREAASSLITRYPISYAPDLKQALSQYTGFEPSWLTTGCGSDDLIDCALRAFLEPGERIAVPDPSFSMMSYFARVNGLQFSPVPLRQDWDIDVEAMLATGARLLYVCSPNNPTSTVASRAALERLVDAAPGIVLLDEAYTEFSRGSNVDLVRSRPNVLVTRTLSKAFGLAGMRVGYAIGRPELVAEVEKARGPYKHNGVAERMAIAALTEDLPWVKAHAGEVQALRQRLVEALEAMGLKPLPTEANFVFVPFPGAIQVAARMREQGVNIRAFQGLTGVGEALRIGCGPWPMMEAALGALREAWR